MQKEEAEQLALTLSRQDKLADDAYMALFDEQSDSFVIYPKVETLAFKVAKTGFYAGKDCCVHTHDEHGHLVSSQTTVYKLVMDHVREFSGDEVYYDEYKNKGKFHNEKPHMAMAKIAFAKALRQAWPELLAGLVTYEEARCELDFGRTKPPGKTVQATDFDITKPDIVHKTPDSITNMVAEVFGNRAVVK
jgi:hypothetical protein